MNASGAVLIIAGIWVGAQLIRGGLIERILPRA